MNFKAIENRCAQHISEHAVRRADQIIKNVAVAIGLNPNTAWGLDDEFLQAAKPLKEHLTKRLKNQLTIKLQAQAEEAALAVVKAELNPPAGQ